MRDNPVNHEDPYMWTEEKLRRKIDQHWDMAGMARQDGDLVDADKHTNKAREYSKVLGQLLRELNEHQQ